jgi:hypothetical protein
MNKPNASRGPSRSRKQLPSIDAVLEAVQADDCMGFCLACGEEAYGVEPDARNYECESCGAPEVFGAEECLIMIGG